MLHVYRQVTGLKKYENQVITRRRSNGNTFPYTNVTVLRKSPLRGIRRILSKLKKQPLVRSSKEIWQVLEIAQRSDARLLHVYLGSEALLLLRLMKAFPRARIVSFHGADLSNQFSSQDYAKLWPHAELFLCRSQSLKKELIAKGCPPKRIRLNYTGVPLPKMTSQPPAWKDDTPIRLLQVCRFIEKKGLEITIMATRLLKDSGISVHLTLVGSGPLESRLRQKSKQLGLDHQVTFTGFLRGIDLEKQFQENDIFCHPSRQTAQGDREGIPNSLLEAMAFGMPVISTRHSGIPEAIDHGKTGILLDVCKPDALANEIYNLLNDHDQFKNLSRNTRVQIEKRFSIKCCTDQLTSSYEEAIRLSKDKTTTY